MGQGWEGRLYKQKSKDRNSTKYQRTPRRPGFGESVVNEAGVVTSKKALNTWDEEFGLRSPRESVS